VSPLDHKDYSGTPLWRKLGIAEGGRVLLVDPPEDLRLDALAPLPDGVTFLRRRAADLDVVVVFVKTRADLRRRFPGLRASIGAKGRLWVAWPKKAAKVSTDLTFEIVQRTGLDAGLVDNKTAAISDVFQGLQFVYRVRDRAEIRGTRTFS